KGYWEKSTKLIRLAPRRGCASLSAIVRWSTDYPHQFPGSSMVEHSAVNRRVASSNLARGATFLPETDLLTQHVTTLLCGCNRVQLRASQPEVQTRSRLVPRPVYETPRL